LNLSKKHYQVAIVGASIAGASLASQLGRAGVKVALLDKSSFPRGKSCGEGLSAASILLLNSILSKEELELIEKFPLFGYEIYQKETLQILEDLKSSCPCVWGIKRWDLDNLIVESLAKYPSIELLLKTSVRGVCQEKQQYLINLDQKEITADYLVLASGGKSKLAESLGVPKIRSNGELRYGKTFHLEGEFESNLKRVAIFIEDKREIFCTRLAKNQLNISFLSSKQGVNDLQRPQELSALKNICKKLKFSPHAISDPVIAGACGFQRRKAVFNRTILIGDACEQLDPIGGMGMTHALESSLCAASALILCLQGKILEEEAFKLYEEEREKLTRPLRGFSRLSFLSLVSYKNFGFIKKARTSFFAKELNKTIHGALQSELLLTASKKTLTFIGRMA
jgi:menaquinone-9 beta-reductase